MTLRRAGQVACLAIVLVLIAVSGWAQAVHDITITGTVKDKGGEVVPGVTVTATSPALVSGERQVISDAQGHFVFLSLPPGTYAVTASLQGFNKFSQKNLVMHAGEATDLKVTLTPEAYQEQVTVTATAPVVDTKTATVSTTFSEELLEKLPTARNAFYDLAMGAPGMASVGGNESWLTSPSAYGSAANENVFLVNGVNATNPRGAPWGTLVNVNYDTVEEVKIVSLGSKAEYGSFSGAAIDVLTKSGGNDFNGDVSYYSMLGNAANNATMNFGSAGNPYDNSQPLFYADPADNLVTKPVGAWEGSITAGGPVLRDRLWFYTGFNKQDSKTQIPLWTPNQTTKQQLFDLKLTGEFAANHRAWLAYHNEKLGLGNQTWGSMWQPTMGYNQNQNNNTFQAQYQWVVNDRNLVSAKYLGFDTNQHPEQIGNAGPGFINWWKWTGTQSIGAGGTFPYIEDYKSNRKTIQADGTHYASDFLGSHELKFGVQYTKSQGNYLGGYFNGYANFAYPYPWDYGPAKNWWWNCDASWCWGTKDNPVFPIYNNKTYQHPWLTKRLASEGGLFLDDTWTVNDRVTLNLGARYDQMTAKYGDGYMYNYPTSPSQIDNLTIERVRKGTGNLYDFKDFSPRLGLTYLLTDDRRTVLRAHVGRYFAPLGVESLRRFGPDMDVEKTITDLYLFPMSEVDLNHDGMIDTSETRAAYNLLAGRAPNTPAFRTSTHNPSWSLEVAPGTKSPYTDQFELSIDRQLGRDYGVELTGIYKMSKNFIALQPYDKGTGLSYDWVSSPFTAFTGYKTKAWQIAMKDYNGDGKVDIDDAKYVMNNTAYRAVNMDNFDGQSVHRDYQGLQLAFTKRYSNRWQALASINWNHSSGVAPRTLNQNWYIDGPMIMDTPFGTSYNDFQNNLEGPSLMTPRLMLKLNGNYTIPKIETDIGMRYRFDNGRPLWPVQNLPTFATWMSSTDGVFLTGNGNAQIVATDPNHPSWMPSTSIFDFNIQKRFAIKGDNQIQLSLDILNAFNENSPNIVGFKQGDYGRVYSIVTPRTFRGGVKFMF